MGIRIVLIFLGYDLVKAKKLKPIRRFNEINQQSK